jgi:alanine racemase
MKTLVIEKKAVKQNLAIVKERAGRAVIYGVLVGDAYGAGLVEMARLLRDEGIRRFAVSECDDAAALRKAGFVDEEILMLRATTDPAELEKLVDLGVVCTICSVDTGLALGGIAERRSTVVEAHLQVDTGMGYGGFLCAERDKLLSMYKNLPNVAISGIYTQVYSAGTGGKQAAQELEAFQALLRALHADGAETGTVHAAGSFALLHYEFARLDAVRAGSILLGRCRRTKGDGLQRVGYGEAALEEVRWLPKGHTVGGETLVVLRRPTRVAVVPVGYLNGFGAVRGKRSGLFSALRRWWRSRRITVRVDGQKARIIGRIGALETLVDVTNLKCAAGDKAYFDIDPMYARGLSREYR